MLIAATGDIHSPRYFDLFVEAVEKLDVKPDLFLIVGDAVDNGKVREWLRVYNVLFGKINCPIISTFGNNEFGKETQDEIRKVVPEVKFLQDESVVLDVNGKKVGIVGSIGSIEWPTFWQRKKFPKVKEEFENRVFVIEGLLKALVADFKILMLHYAPTFKILEGEDPRIWPSLGHRKYEKLLTELKPNLVLCGHSHRGTKLVWVDTVPVFNVALPLNKKIVLIDTEKNLKTGLEKFV